MMSVAEKKNPAAEVAPIPAGDIPTPLHCRHARSAFRVSLAWQFTRRIEVDPDQIIIVESLLPDCDLLRSLIRIGDHDLCDVSMNGHRYQGALRLTSRSMMVLVDRRMRMTFHHPMRVALMHADVLCRALALIDAPSLADADAGTDADAVR